MMPMGRELDTASGRSVRSDIDGQFKWDQEEVEYFWILSEAKQRYAERGLVLAMRGFIYSDMDPIL
jgi:hypothetical protein